MGETIPFTTDITIIVDSEDNIAVTEVEEEEAQTVEDYDEKELIAPVDTSEVLEKTNLLLVNLLNEW